MNATRERFAVAAGAAAEQLADLRGAAIHISGASGFLAANLLALLRAADQAGDLGLALFAVRAGPRATSPCSTSSASTWTASPGSWPPSRRSNCPRFPASCRPCSVVRCAGRLSARAAGDLPSQHRRSLAAVCAGRRGRRGPRCVLQQRRGLRSASGHGDPDARGLQRRARPRLSAIGVRRVQAMAEVLGAVLADEHGIPFTALRPFNLYGPGQRADDGRVPLAFVREAVETGAIALASDGRRAAVPASCGTACSRSLRALCRATAPRPATSATRLAKPTCSALARRSAAAVGPTPTP